MVCSSSFQWGTIYCGEAGYTSDRLRNSTIPKEILFMIWFLVSSYFISRKLFGSQIKMNISYYPYELSEWAKWRYLRYHFNDKSGNFLCRKYICLVNTMVMIFSFKLGMLIFLKTLFIVLSIKFSSVTFHLKHFQKFDNLSLRLAALPS